MPDADETSEVQRRRGPWRRLLRMIVSIDSSRFLGRRFAAAFGLLGLIAVFAAGGYWLPALVMRYLHR